MDFPNVPGWDADPRVSGWAGLPPLGSATTSADACVVGLGGSGLAAVEELAGRGLTVVGVDAGRVAGAAAGRNGGLLLGGGEPAFHEALAAWGDVAADLYRATLTELDHLVDVLPQGVVRRDGSLRLAGGVGVDDTHVARELADCTAQAAALRAHGIAVEEWSGPLGTGIFLPDDAQANPVVRHLGVVAHLLRDHGPTGSGRVHLHEGTPVTAVRPGRVETAHGSICAGVVIVAVDGRLELLLPQLAGTVRTARLQMLATGPLRRDDVERLRERAPCGVYQRWGYDYAQLDLGGAGDPSGGGARLLVGGGRDVDREAEWTTSTEPTGRVQEHVERVTAGLLGRPLGAGEVAHRWAASVGYTAPEHGGRAFCGLVDDGAAGPVAAVGGYSGTGNLVGPVAARAAVRLLLDGEQPPSCFVTTSPGNGGGRGHGQ